MYNFNLYRNESTHAVVLNCSPPSRSLVDVDGTKGLVELLLSLAASIKHLDRSNSNTENTNEEFRKDLEN